MGTKISDIFTVTISRQTARIARAAFNKILILAEHTATANRVDIYGSLEEIEADGHATTSQVYLCARDMLSGERKPKQIYVGRIDAGDADLAASLTAIRNENDAWYGITFADPDASKADIVALAAIAESANKFLLAQSSDANILDGADSTDVASAIKAAAYDRTVVMYHDERAAQIQTVTFDEDFASGNTVDIDVNATGSATTVTYATSHANTMGLIAAAIAAFANVASATYDSDTDTITVTMDVGHDASNAPYEGDLSFTYGGGYTGSETVTETQAAALNKHLSAELGAIQMTKDAGSSNWEYKTAAGITADEFEADEIAALEAKNCGRYEEIGGVNMTQGVLMGSGEYPDIIHGSDWLAARIAERLLTLEVNNERVPFTDAGIAMVVNQVDAQLKIASKDPYNLITPDYTIDAPTVDEVDAADKSSRVYNGLTASATFQGAINKVGLTVYLTN